MTEKELRKLGRAELLELLLEQSKENERLYELLEEKTELLEERTIAMDNAGSIAEASLQLSGVFAAAQKAADQYLDNVKVLTENQEKLCAQLEAESKEQSEKLIAESKEQSEKLLSESQEQSEKLLKESQEQSEKLINETEMKCRIMEEETKQKCAEMTEAAETESKQYWEEVSEKMQEFVKQQEGLKQLLSSSKIPWK